jgi:hypothetical protein
LTKKTAKAAVICTHTPSLAPMLLWSAGSRVAGDTTARAREFTSMEEENIIAALGDLRIIKFFKLLR